MRLTDEQSRVAAGELYLAYYVAEKMRHCPAYRHLTADEVRSAAGLAACEAARAHDPRKGSFSTVLTMYVRNRLTDAVASSRAVYVPHDAARNAGTADAAAKARRCGTMRPGAWALSASRERSPLERAAAAEAWDALRLLPERHREVIEWAFRDGIDCVEIGRRLGVGRTRARGIREQALARLREAMGVDKEAA